MTKIVYNACYGGFSLSFKAACRIAELKGEPLPEKANNYDAYLRDICRHDATLVQVVEELEEEANGASAQLRIAEIPSGSKYRIDEYDGTESVETPESYVWETAS